MLPAATALTELLAPKVIDALKPASSPDSPLPASSPPMVPGSLPGDDRVVLSTQSLPPNPPPPLGSSLGRSSSVVRFPFQDKILDVSGKERLNYSQLVSSCAPVKRHIHYFRDAWVSELEAVVFPSALSLKTPVTVDLCWTGADIAPSGENVLATPASARLTIGGLALLHQGILPADLGHINPIIKSPIPYSNTPRLSIYTFANPDVSDDQSRATVYIRGIIHCSHPLLTPGTTS